MLNIPRISPVPIFFVIIILVRHSSLQMFELCHSFEEFISSFMLCGAETWI
jgi:hypothetical protein